MILSVTFGLKLFILLLEAHEKRSLLKKSYQSSAPETTSGIYNRSTFWWLRDVFRKGFGTVLTVGTLMPLDDEINAATDSQRLVERWNRGKFFKGN